MNKAPRQQAEAQGRRAEALAAWVLRLKGYRIIARRARCSRGEIDLIARRGRIVCFIEVKRRRSLEDATAALNAHALRRVFAAAHALAPRFVKNGDTIRFDAVVVAPGCWPRHLTNIWHE